MFISAVICNYLLLAYSTIFFYLSESPDLNSIENMWHEMKEYIRIQIKPVNERELTNGILRFWGTVTVAKCNAYINHLQKVMPEVIRANGNASGY